MVVPVAAAVEQMQTSLEELEQQGKETMVELEPLLVAQVVEALVQ
jgi:hypothetical protein